MAGTERYVRNSTADFLVFTKDSETDGIEVRVQDHEVWLTQKGIGQLFDVDRSVVAKHLRNIFAENELSESTTCAKFAQVADNGKTYHYKFYSLPAIIAVGYRTNSTRATQFRQWATKVLDTFTRQGYVLDKDRLINGQIFDEDYFDHLVSEIQEIRASERRFYQKITDIYATMEKTIWKSILCAMLVTLTACVLCTSFNISNHALKRRAVEIAACITVIHIILILEHSVFFGKLPEHKFLVCYGVGFTLHLIITRQTLVKCCYSVIFNHFLSSFRYAKK